MGHSGKVVEAACAVMRDVHLNVKFLALINENPWFKAGRFSVFNDGVWFRIPSSSRENRRIWKSVFDTEHHSTHWTEASHVRSYRLPQITKFTESLLFTVKLEQLSYQCTWNHLQNIPVCMYTRGARRCSYSWHWNCILRCSRGIHRHLNRPNP